MGIALPFYFSSDNASSTGKTDPAAITLPGPCTVNNAPGWGCASNVVVVERMPKQEMDTLCQDNATRVYDHPVVLVYRNFPNVMHWLSDQVVPFFFAIDEFGLSNTTVQIVALDEVGYHRSPKKVAFLDTVWQALSGASVVRMADHVKHSFCTRTAILGSPAHPLISYNVDLSTKAVIKDRPRHQKFAKWFLSKYNVSHPAAEARDPSQPVITLIDRTAERFRTIMNQDEVMSIARSFSMNARAVKLEAMSIDEQLRTAAQTDVLIGVHGAGMAMAAFLPPWGVVVELKPFGFGTGIRDFYPGFCSWARLHGIQYMGWHNRDRARSKQAGTDPLYFKNFHTSIDPENITFIIQSAINLTLVAPKHRRVNECTQLNAPILPVVTYR